MGRFFALLLAGLLSACAMAPPAPVALRPRFVSNEGTTLAARQIRRCYRAPRVTGQARQISTTLRLRFTEDGALADVPRVIAQGGVTSDNRPYAGKMAEAAILAVLRCTPLRLPAELYRDGWDDFEISFNPGMAA